MALSFPSSPSLNQTYTVGSKTWTWNGSAWSLLAVTGTTTDSTARQFATDAANTATAAYAQANTATTLAGDAGSYANGAFTTANNALPKTGGTITGDLSVTGNLVIAGGSTYVNTAIYQTVDSLIELAANNTGDAVDIGFYGQANSSTYTGLVKQAGTNNYLLFKGLSSPTGTNLPAGSATAANVATLIANVQAYSVTIGGVDALGYTTTAYTRANSAYDTANSAGILATSSYNTVNSAFALANTHTTSITNVGVYANGAFTQANTATTSATNANIYANGAFTQANTATTSATNANLYANGAFVQANTAVTSASNANIYANGAFTQANTAATNAITAGAYANAAFAAANSGSSSTFAFERANSAYNKANNALANTGGTITGDLTVSGNVTVLSGLSANTFYANNIISPAVSNTVIVANNYSTTFDTLGGVTIQGGKNSTSNTTGTLVISSGGLGLSGNLYSGSIVITGSSSNGITFVDGTTITTSPTTLITNVGVYSNGAFVQANAAFVQANNNNTLTTASFLQANTAQAYAINAGNFANGSFYVANTAYNNSTTVGNYANASYIRANSAFDIANLVGSYANSSYTLANTNATTLTLTQSYANSAFTAANAAGSSAMVTSAYGTANAAFVEANSAYVLANAAFAKANTGGAAGTDDWARLQANAAFAAANSGSSATSAFNQANAAFEKANSAYSLASGGGGSGSASIGVNLDKFIADGLTDQFVLSVTPSSANNIIVNLNGIEQLDNAYTLLADTLTLSEIPVVNTAIEVRTFSTNTVVAELAYGQANAAFTQANTKTSLGKSIAMTIVFGG